MKFNRYLPKDIKKLLEDQYNEYVKTTPMSKKEMHALREWVTNGNSVYENPSCRFAEFGVPVEFITDYRDKEYVRKHTKGMSSEEKEQFIIDYYGCDIDDECEYIDYLTGIPEPFDDMPF